MALISVTIATPIDSTDGSVFYEYDGLAPVTGDQVIYDDLSTPSGIAITVTSSGVWQFASMPTVTQTFQAHVLHANGASSIPATFTFTVDTNVNPVADDDTFSIPENASNGDTVGTYVATDVDGTVDSYSITGSVLGINNDGDITLLDNTGLTAGSDITATVTATDDGGKTDTALITVNITVVLPVIISTTGNIPGAVTTITTDTGIDLTAASTVTATRGGIAMTSITVTSATTLTGVEPLTGLEVGVNADIVLTVDGLVSAAFSAPYLPILGQVVTLSVAWADLHPDSFLRKAEYSALDVGDQIDLVSTSPGGYTVQLDTVGLLTLLNATGASSEDIDYYIIEASDPYGRSGLGTETILINTLPTGLPIITGTTLVGNVLTVDGSGIADGDGLGTFAYQWKRNGVDISGETSTTYTLVAIDYTTIITCTISYTDVLGIDEVLTSIGTAAITTQIPVGLPTISGVIKEGEVLTVRTDGISDGDGLGAFSYQWKIDNADIPGETNTTYLLAFEDIGGVITVEVSYVDGVGVTEVLISADSIPVVEISRVISIISANRIVDIDGVDVTYTFPLWEIWDKIPEDPTAVVIDSGIDLAIVNGIGATPELSNILDETEYLLIGRDSGNTPTLLFRIWGTPA